MLRDELKSSSKKKRGEKILDRDNEKIPVNNNVISNFPTTSDLMTRFTIGKLNVKSSQTRNLGLLRHRSGMSRFWTVKNLLWGQRRLK